LAEDLEGTSEVEDVEGVVEGDEDFERRGWRGRGGHVGEMMKGAEKTYYYDLENLDGGLGMRGVGGNDWEELRL